MTAMNSVRMKVKPGRDQEYLDAHKRFVETWPGLIQAHIIKTGEGSYCVIGEWADMDALAAARPHMLESLDSYRDILEDLGDGMGVTDPVSGQVVLSLKPGGNWQS